jgi:hypothetical protein
MIRMILIGLCHFFLWGSVLRALCAAAPFCTMISAQRSWRRQIDNLSFEYKVSMSGLIPSGLRSLKLQEGFCNGQQVYSNNTHLHTHRKPSTKCSPSHGEQELYIKHSYTACHEILPFDTMLICHAVPVDLQELAMKLATPLHSSHTMI